MKTLRLLRHASLCAAAALCAHTACAQDRPSAPVNLKAEGDYDAVVLTWDRFASDKTLLQEGFEGSVFQPEGWSVSTVNTASTYNTWFHFPTDELREELGDFYLDNVHQGEHSAAIFFDVDAPHEDGSPSTQDERLITPAMPGASYISFWHMIDPMILEYGAYDEFGDHYTVEVSHDGGQTWDVLWDARYDSDGSEGWQPVTLYLGDPGEGDPVVSFHALSNTENPDESLYFTWFIDDIATSDDPSAARPDAPAARPAGALRHKKFDTTGLTPHKRPHREAKAAPQESFNIYLDGNRVAEGIRALTYTDNTPKAPGRHTYQVRSYSSLSGTESEPAEAVVDTKGSTFNPPTNVGVSYSYDEESGRYDVTLTWDEPEGDRTPAGYNAYRDGMRFGSELDLGGVGQSGLYKGVYNYAVTAVYASPDGESAPAGDIIALGTRYPAWNLRAEPDGNGGLTLAWDAPKASEHEVSGYQVFRGNEKLAVTDACSYSEAQTPVGVYDYAVRAVYSDGFVSVPVCAEVANGESVPCSLPFTETFDGGLKPGNWQVLKDQEQMSGNYLWRFDNWFELPVGGAPFEGGFASVNSSAAGYTQVASTLVTPPVSRGAADGSIRTMLEFDLDYKAGGSLTSATLGYMTADGADPVEIETLEGYTDESTGDGITPGPVHKRIDVTECFSGGVPVMFTWQYKGFRSNYMAIDNVWIHNVDAAGVSVTDAACPVRIEAAGGVITVRGEGIGTVRVARADGSCVSEAAGCGRNEVSMAYPVSGVCIVKVTLGESTVTKKICLR